MTYSEEANICSSSSSYKSLKKKSHVRLSDRYLPLRNSPSTSLKDLLLDSTQNESISSSNASDKSDKMILMDLYKAEILGQRQNNNNQSIKSFKNYNSFKYIHQNITNSVDLSTKGLLNLNQSSLIKQSSKKICKSSHKILDAPQLLDDFYLNLLDWSSNIVSVGLKSSVYLWCSNNHKTTLLTQLKQSQLVCGISTCQSGSQIVIGSQKGRTQLWDCNKCSIIRTFNGHKSRVGSISWSDENIFATGSNDHKILIRDKRVSEQFVKKLKGHKDQICGLKFSFDKHQLVSGGNDNQLNIWNLQSESPVITIRQHQSAVRALAWSPNQHGLLASGGGVADKTIRLWNSLTGEQVKCIQTKSQVCNLIFSKNTNQLVSTHGYCKNEINLWRLPNLQKIQFLTGHTQRVLYLAMNPQGTTLVTGAGNGDQTLRFWDMFPQKQKIPYQQQSKLSVSSLSLR